MTDSAQFTEPLLFAYYTFEFESVALHVYRWFAIDVSTAFLFSSANVRKLLTCIDFGTNGPIEPSVPSFHVSHNSRRVIDAWFCPSPPHHSIKTICVLVSLFILFHKHPSNDVSSSCRLPHLDAHHIIEPDVGSINHNQTEKVVDWNFPFSFKIPHCIIELDAHQIIEPDVDSLNCNQTERVVEWNSCGQMHYNMFNNVAWELERGVQIISPFGVGDIGQTMLYLVDASFVVEYNVWNCVEPDFTDHPICNPDENIGICAIQFVVDFVTFFYQRVINIVDVSSIL